MAGREPVTGLIEEFSGQRGQRSGFSRRASWFGCSSLKPVLNLAPDAGLNDESIGDVADSQQEFLSDVRGQREDGAYPARAGAGDAVAAVVAVGVGGCSDVARYRGPHEAAVGAHFHVSVVPIDFNVPRGPKGQRIGIEKLRSLATTI